MFLQLFLIAVFKKRHNFQDMYAPADYTRRELMGKSGNSLNEYSCETESESLRIWSPLANKKVFFILWFVIMCDKRASGKLNTYKAIQKDYEQKIPI